ncbi:uncharacterized protein LOC113337008 [Papaver somniferum]|uniref:uncharacterized protein LOC113337008 n=1 Tax=Papaver somniferum TaxID=3469 RepID=UPI000E6F7712|nr:uncharacterized protein LOC113337008 [Papaver somniferum]
MVCKSSQVWLLLIFAILASYAYTERVSADNKYCPADNLENVEHVDFQNCGYDYKNCKQWCLDRGKWFAENYIKRKKGSWNSGFITFYKSDCICCCRDAIAGQDPPPSVLPPPRANKYCPADNIEVIRKRRFLLSPCANFDEYDNCAEWCKKRLRNYATRLQGGDEDCVCCCQDATPPPPPPCLPSSPPPPPLPTPPCQECVCALNNRYCPANNIERVWPNMICGDGASTDFKHCQSWCAVRGRSYTTNRYPLKDGRDDCVCCCGDALRPPPPPPLPSQG